MPAKKGKPKYLQGEINGGEWVLDIVFETKSGERIESTRTEARFAESQINDKDETKRKAKQGNFGLLFWGRTRELLRKGELL